MLVNVNNVFFNSITIAMLHLRESADRHRNHAEHARKSDSFPIPKKNFVSLFG